MQLTYPCTHDKAKAGVFDHNKLIYSIFDNKRDSHCSAYDRSDIFWNSSRIWWPSGTILTMEYTNCGMRVMVVFKTATLFLPAPKYRTRNELWTQGWHLEWVITINNRPCFRCVIGFTGCHNDVSYLNRILLEYFGDNSACRFWWPCGDIESRYLTRDIHASFEHNPPCVTKL